MSRLNTNEQVCNTITKISKKYPYLRMMQLISNCIPTDVMERLDNDLYYLTNEDLMAYLLTYEADTLNKGEI